MISTNKGFLITNGFRIYVEIYGRQSAKTPLLILHGGPGAAHNYLLSLALLANNDRQVIFYDQLGCGLSDMPDDDSLWEVERFVNELIEVRKQLQLSDVHLLGHSWGGMLAITYLQTNPSGIKSLILASSMISLPLYQTEVTKLKKRLPTDVYKTMVLNEEAGTTDSSEYKKAYGVYSSRHVFRGTHYPAEFKTPKGRNGDAVYKKMWGPSEAYVNGTLKTWNAISKLREISVPTLVISGEFDELTPKQAKITAEQIRGSRSEIIKDASHCAHIEKQEEYLGAVNEFLVNVESMVAARAPR